MADVYLAQDVKHQRKVAIKVLRPEISTAVGTARFHREIEAAAHLNHPNVLPLHDSGEADGLLFFVMPYVEGESLRSRLDREGSLPLEDALKIAGEVGDALAYAHEHGLVHRDVKPGNILFQAGHALVCDFGIAQAARQAEEPLTRTGVAIGTIPYMSPEQLSGDRPVDRRTDIYALGCILHEMLSGANPFAGNTPESALAKKVTGTVPDLTALRPDVPHTVQAVVERALAVDPARRPETASALTTELTRAVTLQALEQDQRRRRTRRILRDGLVAAAVIAVSSVVWWGAHRAAGPRMERIAVLPFRNTENDTTQQFYVKGLHQDLIVEMSKAIRVINPGSVVQYASTTLPVRQIAQELRVDGVVQGSVTRGPDGVSLDLHLVDSETEEIVWSQAFEAAARNIASLYHDATLAIARQMGVALTPEALARLSPTDEVDPQVYDALLQARFHWQHLTSAGIDTAEEYFQLALQRDSLSAEAWVGLAQIWGLRAQMGFVSGAEAIRLAQPYMDRAAALDPTLASVQSQIALRMTWSEWRFQEARPVFVAALAADPTNSLLRAYYALLLLYLDRDEEALEEIERAAALDPFNILIQGLLAQDLNFLRRYEDAEAVLLRTMERDPEAPIVLSTLRTTYHLMGRHEEAMEMWRASYRALGDQEALDALEVGYRAGGYSAALRSVAELFLARAETQYVTPWQIATLFTRAGSAEPALDHLEGAFRDHDNNMPSIAIDPIFDFIREEPRFQALVDSLGLPR